MSSNLQNGKLVCKQEQLVLMQETDENLWLWEMVKMIFIPLHIFKTSFACLVQIWVFLGGFLNAISNIKHKNISIEKRVCFLQLHVISK